MDVDNRIHHVLDSFLGEQCGNARSGVMEDPKFQDRLDEAELRIQELESTFEPSGSTSI